MSSYVISKQEYVKIAGFIAGLQAAEKYGESALYWWNHKENRLHNDKSIKALILTAYDCNVISVMKQYNEDQSEFDENEYNELFQEYKQKSYSLYSRCQFTTLKKYYYSLIAFISCFNYQTEDEMLNNKGMMILQTALYKVSKLIFQSECNGFWGTFSDEKES